MFPEIEASETKKNSQHAYQRKVHYSRSGTPNNIDRDLYGKDRTIAAIDREEYKKLEEKQNRIMLKKKLYEKKKVEDEEQVLALNEDLKMYEE